MAMPDTAHHAASLPMPVDQALAVLTVATIVFVGVALLFYYDHRAAIDQIGR